MTLRMVNGHSCRNCAEEAVAKRGSDPSKPVTLQNSSTPKHGLETPRGVNQPEPGAQLGSLLNLRA